MRLLFVISKYFEFGGLQRDMLRLARACANQGADVTILCGIWEGEKPQDVNLLLEPLTALSNHTRNFELSRRIAALRQDPGFDAVIGFHKLAGLDVYYGGDTCFAEKISRSKPRWFRWLPRYRHFLRLEAAVFGKHIAAEILLLVRDEIPLYQKHYGTDASRCHLLPPGIDRERLLRNAQSKETLSSLRKEIGLSGETRILLHVGSDFKRKGIDRCIRAMADLPRAIQETSALVIVGSDDAAPYERMARELNVETRVKFVGGRKDVDAFYQISHLLVHPAYVETAGMVLLEALVCGLPVICSGACGYGFHIERAQAGRVLTEPFSQKEFNDALAAALQSPLDEWRQNGRRYADEQELDGMVAGALKVIFKRAEQNMRKREETRG